MKKLSIITINFNNRDGLRRTIESVVAQTTRDFEYIVIDGGSTDGSVEVIKEYEEYINYWVSEPDKGIYNAMNKGVKHAHGEYCNFLNSGDVFFDDSVIRNFLDDKSNESILSGAVRFVNYTKGYKEVEHTHFPQKTIKTEFLLIGSISHQASFIRHDLLIETPYDESYRIVSDWKFWLEQLVIRETSYKDLNFIVCDFDTTGCSMKEKHIDKLERQHVLETLFLPKLINDYKDLYSRALVGETKLEKMIKSEPPNGTFEKTLTVIGSIILKITKVKNLFKGFVKNHPLAV